MVAMRPAINKLEVLPQSVASSPNRRAQMKWSGPGAAAVAGHLQDIALGGATSESGLLQGRRSTLRVPPLGKAALPD